MSYIHWSRDLDTGIAEIDAQHRRIVDYINELAANQNNGNHQAVVHVLNELIEYTLEHFSYEEDLQIRAKYAFYATHKRTHNKFAKRVHEFKRRADNGENVGHEVLAMLKKWLVHHIKGDDADYVSTVRQSLNMQGEIHDHTGGWIGNTLRRFFG